MKQTKLWLQNRVGRWKTDRQVPEYVFRLRNIVQEKPKIRNSKDFRDYQPKEVYVELKIFKALEDTRPNRNVYSFSVNFPDGVWIEQDGEPFGFTGTGNLKNIIVPKWFMDKVKTTTKTIYKMGGLMAEAQGTGSFVQDIQAYGVGETFLEQLQDVCRFISISLFISIDLSWAG